MRETGGSAWGALKLEVDLFANVESFKRRGGHSSSDGGEMTFSVHEDQIS